jgi:4-hydroxybenzoyl-CoA reductase subunit beta
MSNKSLITTEKIYYQPNSLEEAIEIAANNIGRFKYIAGGTDLLVNKYQGNIEAECLIDLTHINELQEIKCYVGFLHIGSLVKLSELKNYSIINQEFPVLIEAANSVGSPLVRNSATLGGNLLCENRCLYYNQSEWWRDSVGYCLKCNGDICIVTGTGKTCYSEFIADTVPALISMNAKISAIDGTDEKTLNLEDIYTGDGVNPVNLNKTAIIRSIILPRNRGYRSVFKKLRQRESIEYTSLTSAVTVDSEGNLIISLSGVDPKPVVVRGTIKSNNEILIQEALKKSRSVDNDMLSRKYRREMIKTYLNDSLKKLIDKNE